MERESRERMDCEERHQKTRFFVEQMLRSDIEEIREMNIPKGFFVKMTFYYGIDMDTDTIEQKRKIVITNTNDFLRDRKVGVIYDTFAKDAIIKSEIELRSVGNDFKTMWIECEFIDTSLRWNWIFHYATPRESSQIIGDFFYTFEMSDKKTIEDYYNRMLDKDEKLDKMCKEAGQYKHKCKYCNARKQKSWKCSGCKSVYYCSRHCQKEDWKFHTRHCADLKIEREKQKRVPLIRE